ncbi:LruC domain-containing protein [Paradesertivirga mongoliensis]|uniref:LruC domain-containing protein n=1 Tax=Paradesertivirga mongoliensis TaxID=2100740 RepID=A0ABW4ZFW1_9SPHI|nr:LruC domain-containing protein [Pedobacter mongoliensis]
MKFGSSFLLALFFAFFFVSCHKDDTSPGNFLGDKIAPDGFNFSTSKSVDVSVRLLSNLDEPVKRSMVNINSSLSGETLLRGLTDDNGYFKASVNIPAYMETLTINPQNPGLSQNIQGLIKGNALTCVIGGKSGLSGDVIKSNSLYGKSFLNRSSRTLSTTYPYMGTLDGTGRPLSYLEDQPGTVSANLLSYLAAALPNQQDIRVHHPQYVSDNATEHLNIVQLSDVWITFVAEGAGNLNSIGFYTYPTNAPPTTVNDIGEVKLLFPNASAAGTGGSMVSGDKVHIGRYSEGTSIGFVLFSFGWQGGNIVHVNNPKFYSDSKFNPEPSSSLQSHTVLLNYPLENQYVIGFEDLNRTDPSCDHDFNDVILYATSNPVTGISTSGVPTMGPATDTDGDGVYDNNDEFPEDPARAYTSYYPSKNTMGTLAFEDNWPAKGDYDMNDLVVKYRYKYINNGNNRVVAMGGDFVVDNAFASYTNGFGVELPFSSNLISTVTGQRRTVNYSPLNSNGTESGQTNAVIIPFENHKTLLAAESNGVKDTVHVNVSFVTPQVISVLYGAPYNPFLIGNLNRGAEVHLPGKQPTSRANLSLFGTMHDNSIPANNKYYLSAENWPWALNFTETFEYPKEGAAINDTYLHFGDWATSGGAVFTDWYSNTSSGYRTPAKIH